jgi:hypothetical protein
MNFKMHTQTFSRGGRRQRLCIIIFPPPEINVAGFFRPHANLGKPPPSVSLNGARAHVHLNREKPQTRGKPQRSSEREKGFCSNIPPANFSFHMGSLLLLLDMAIANGRDFGIYDRH